MALTAPDKALTQQIQLGLSDHDSYFYSEPSTTVAKTVEKFTKTLTANTADQSVNLATQFPAITTGKQIIIREVTGTGIGYKIGTAAGAGKIPIGASRKAPVVIPIEGALPTLYFDTTVAAQVVDIEITVIGS